MKNVAKVKRKKNKEVNIGVAIINCRVIIFHCMSRIKPKQSVTIHFLKICVLK